MYISAVEKVPLKCENTDGVGLALTAERDPESAEVVAVSEWFCFDFSLL